MNIKRIDTHNQSMQNKAMQRNTISFGEGKVDAYFDFDNTFCPASQLDLKTMSPSKDGWFEEYCKNFKNFLDNTKEGFRFHITTGRTLGEYKGVLNLIRSRGFKLPMPDSIIAKNGSDEYLKSSSDADFYSKGIFPFSQDKTNLEKEAVIKAQTNWDGPKIQAKVKEVLNKHGLRIVEAESEHSPQDYGSDSLFSEGKLRYEDNGKVKLTPGMKPAADWNVGIRRDGNCKVFVTYPYDMLYSPERVKCLAAITSEIKKFLAGENIKAYSYIEQSKRDCGGRTCMVIEPLVDESLKNSFQSPEDKGLTKLFDTKAAVQRAIQNNDLVIAAGDSVNDVSMLNPLLYLDFDESLFSDDGKIDRNADLKFILESIEKDPEKFADISKQLEDLPFVGIIIKGEGEDSSILKDIAAAFKDGKYKKIVEVDPGHLEDGIKEAIRLHAGKNPEFMEKLSPDLKEVISQNTTRND